MGKKYIEPIDFGSESLFPIDSFPEVPERKKKRQIIRSIHPENKLENIPRRAMIDLDGTIHKYSKGYDDGTIYDDPFAGAKKIIEWLKRLGYEIVIFTTRASQRNAIEQGGDHKKEIQKVGKWLDKHGIHFDRITAEKLAADFYIDDKAIHIQDGNWAAVLKVIKKRINYKVAEATRRS